MGVVVAKQVAPFGHKSLATWMFPTVIPVEVSAFVRTKVYELAVALPVVSKHVKTLLLPIPPHAPADSEPMLVSVIVEAVMLLLMFPENPMTGPPSRSVFEPDIEMLTQTELASAVQLPEPPWVKVIVPTWVEPKSMLSVMLSAQTAGASAITAAMASAKIRNFLFRTAVSPLFRSV